MLHPLDQVVSPCCNRFMDDLRIGEGKVGWADGIQELAQNEGQPPALLVIQALDALHCM